MFDFCKKICFKKRVIFFMIFICLSSYAGSILSIEVHTFPLKRVAVVKLPGNPARFDYQSMDLKYNRLYINEMGAGRLLVFDTKNDKLVAYLKGFTNATGVLAVPSLHRVFISSPKYLGDGKVVALNSITLKTEGSAKVGYFPDGISYVPKLKRIFVSNEMGGEISVLNAVNLNHIGVVSLNGEAGMNVYDNKDKIVWVNNQSTNYLLGINPESLKIVRKIKIPHICKSNHGLLIDAKDGLAFVGCEDSNRLVLMDIKNGLALGIYKVGKIPDVMAFDIKQNVLYVATESGILSIFKLKQKKLFLIGSKYIGDDAHTISINPLSDKVYLPIKDFNAHPVLFIYKYTKNSF